jgi:hypothetical protein
VSGKGGWIPVTRRRAMCGRVRTGHLFGVQIIRSTLRKQDLRAKASSKWTNAVRVIRDEIVKSRLVGFNSHTVS